MKSRFISDSIKYIGADDPELDIFEGQYELEDGMCYNSYIIKDDKIVVMDTIDARKSDEWMNNLEKELDGKEVDYLVISHMEPDHSANIGALASKYPNMKLVGNETTFKFLNQFFGSIDNLDERKVVVSEGDKLNTGSHTLTFVMAPMVHWPEVMFTYDETDKVLFSADAFGKFGVFDADEDDWDCEARRYYFNIVGKYGVQVQAVLKKASALDIKTICPLHGPILSENLEHYINKYDVWSKYEPEDSGIFIAYASIHGNTKKAALRFKEILEEKGFDEVHITDLTRDDLHEAIEDAFRYDRLALFSSSYNMGLFPPMDYFLSNLVSKNYQKRKVAIVENGTWAPSAARCMNEYVAKMNNMQIIGPQVTIKSTLNDETEEKLKELADNLIKG